jgi:hypothetical protein
VAVKRLTGAVAISAGGEFSMALLSNGTVDAWGNDESGQLGNSSVEGAFSGVPIAVESLSGVSAIAAGAAHGLALLSNGTVMAWGDDSAGELGNGVVKASQPSPVAVSGLSGVTSISAGTMDSAALLSSGSVMTWGTDASGVLGDGISSGISDVPVAVVGLSKAASISAGRAHMLAFGEPIPTVSAVSPSLGSSSGGAEVTITGTSLGEATAVKFGTQAASFTVNSSTSITAIAPPAPHGTVDVIVTTASGSSPPIAADRYTYQVAPTVTKLSPKAGPAVGGTSVTLTGSEFTGASAVSFGATNASEFTVLSPTSISAVAPPGTPGTVDVKVTNTAGTSPATSKDHYKYLPTVSGVSPNTGSTHGGESVTVSGSSFAVAAGATSFKFGKVKATSVSCASSSVCTMTVPAQAAGTVNVVATVNKANSAINPGDTFTYS